MTPTHPTLPELDGARPDQRAKHLAELSIGALTPLRFRLDHATGRVLRNVLEAVTGRPPQCAAGDAYGCTAGVVAIMKAQLGGRWPDTTLHRAQSLTLHRVFPSVATIQSNGQLKSIEARRHHAKVVLSSQSCCDGEAVATHSMTLYWPTHDGVS